MRFYEFAPVRYLQTPAVSNVPAEPITQFKNIAVIPDDVKHQRIQQLQAAQIAHSANQVVPTKHDLEMAFYRYGAAQSEANKEFRREQRLKFRNAKTKKTQSNFFALLALSDQINYPLSRAPSCVTPRARSVSQS